MFKVSIFKNTKGESTVLERLRELQTRSAKDKNARIQLYKIDEYIEILKKYGTRAGEQYTKHIEGDIWELRPLRDRIFFFFWLNNERVLTSIFLRYRVKSYEIQQIEQI